MDEIWSLHVKLNETDSLAPFTEADLPPLVRLLKLRPNIAMCARDEHRRVQWCDVNFAKQFRLTPEDLVGSTMADLYGEDVANSRLALTHPQLAEHGMFTCIQVWGGMRVTTHTWNQNRERGDRSPIVTVFDPRPVASPELDAQLLTFLDPVWGTFDMLSRRELEVLYLVAKGLNIEESAEILTRSHKTVENHVGSLYTKLGVHSRAEVTRIAVERGILAFSQEQWFTISSQSPRVTTAGKLMGKLSRTN